MFCEVVQVGDLLREHAPNEPAADEAPVAARVDGADLEVRTGPEGVDRLNGLEARDLHQRRMSKVLENICLAAFMAVTLAS